MGTCHRPSDIHRGLTERNRELKFQEADLCYGTCNQVVFEGKRGPRSPKMNFLELESTQEYSQNEIVKRKGDLIDWLTKNRIPVTESLEDSDVLWVIRKTVAYCG